MKDIDVDKIKKILITRTDRIGDVVLSTPVFEALKKSFPDKHIAVMVTPFTRAVVSGNPYVDEIVEYDKRGEHKSILSTIRFAFKLREKHFDCIICLHPTNRVHAVAFFSGIPFRIGYKKKNAFFLTHSIEDKKMEGKKHESEYNFDLLSFLALSVPENIIPFFPVSDADDQDIKDVLDDLQMNGPFAAMFCGASCPSKLWPVKHFAELSRKIYNTYGISVVLVGGKDDSSRAREIMGEFDFPIFDLTGKLSLKMLGAFFKRCKFLVSNDSGPAHIAAALGVPVISIFGRKDAGLSPERWRPLGTRSWFLHKDVGCGECLAHNCVNGFRCLEEISADEVFDLIKLRDLL